MIECHNISIRETLPELVHDALDDDMRGYVQEHVAMCAACAAEVDLMRAVVASVPVPVIDIVRIASTVTPYRRQGRRSWMSPAHLRLAATFLVTAVGVSAITIGRHRHSDPMSASGAPVAAAWSGVELIGVSDLSDDHLEQLMGEMDHLDAIPPSEPEPAMASDGGA